MAATVTEAFSIFQSNFVDLRPTISDSAKGSRDWLLNIMADFNNDHEFVDLYAGKHMHFGSFARKTKIPELDDINLMIAIKANGSVYYGNNPWNDVPIFIPDTYMQLKDCCDEGTNQLNSGKVINRFAKKLGTVHQYCHAQIDSNQEVCRLDLNGHTWRFDIVPCFFAKADDNGRSYYLIPNGNGNWMKSDPRIDQRNVNNINQSNEGRALPLIRLVKFWQNYARIPSMKPYLLETISMNHFWTKGVPISQPYYLELPALFHSISQAIVGPVADPKGIQADINETSYHDRLSISARASLDFTRSTQAVTMEANQDIAGSMACWNDIFGPLFPKHF